MLDTPDRLSVVRLRIERSQAARLASNRKKIDRRRAISQSDGVYRSRADCGNRGLRARDHAEVDRRIALVRAVKRTKEKAGISTDLTTEELDEVLP